ncbi:MAG: PilZ domain-containing protein [Magnetococcales bacterium]|nr:PilZ domain-containing protein [Magnetococcales bacterium]
MELEKTDSSSNHRRSHERVLFKKEAILRSANGQSAWGLTRDVSLRGAFLVIPNTNHGFGIGDAGFLKLPSLGSDKEFPCRVVHVNDKGIGLELHGKSINFGAILTESLLMETQVRLGVDLEPMDHIHVKITATSSTMPKKFPNVHLIKISETKVEFLYPSSSDWTPSLGESLNLEIRKQPHLPIMLEGVVRALSTTQSRNAMNPEGKICSMILPTMPKEKGHAIRELVRDLHAKRLKQLAADRASYFALSSGPDPLPRKHSEIVHDIGRFFKKSR